MKKVVCSLLSMCKPLISMKLLGKNTHLSLFILMREYIIKQKGQHHKKKIKKITNLFNVVRTLTRTSITKYLGQIGQTYKPSLQVTSFSHLGW